MTDSKTWMIDDIAAANLARALGVDLGQEQLEIVAEHLAGHRTSAFDLAVSRMRSSILDRIHHITLNDHVHRSPEWSEGCRSAEHAILTMTPAEFLEVASPRERSKGQVLRTMLRQARKSLPGAGQSRVHG